MATTTKLLGEKPRKLLGKGECVCVCTSHEHVIWKWICLLIANYKSISSEGSNLHTVALRGRPKEVQEIMWQSKSVCNKSMWSFVKNTKKNSGYVGTLFVCVCVCVCVCVGGDGSGLKVLTQHSGSSFNHIVSASLPRWVYQQALCCQYVHTADKTCGIHFLGPHQ